MTAVRVVEVRDLSAVVEALEDAGWKSYGKVAAEVMGDVPPSVINSAHQQGLEWLAAEGLTPAVFGVTTRVAKNGFGSQTMVMWVASVKP